LPFNAVAVDANARCSLPALIFCCRLLSPWRRSAIAIVAHIRLANFIAITFVALHQHPDSVISVSPLMLHRIIASNSAIPDANQSYPLFTSCGNKSGGLNPASTRCLQLGVQRFRHRRPLLPRRGSRPLTFCCSLEALKLLLVFCCSFSRLLFSLNCRARACFFSPFKIKL
jgi:hypothetical protein